MKKHHDDIVIDRIGEVFGTLPGQVDVDYHYTLNGMETGDGGQSHRVTLDWSVYDDDGLNEQALTDYVQAELERIYNE